MLDWIVRRVSGQVDAEEGLTGRVPNKEDFNLEGLDEVTDEVWDKLFETDPGAWANEVDETEEYFTQFGSRLPEQISEQLTKFRERINAAKEA